MPGLHSDSKEEKYLNEELSHKAIAADDDSEYQEYVVLAEEFSGAALTKLTVSHIPAREKRAHHAAQD